MFHAHAYISGEGADVMQRGRYSTPPPENKRSAENDREKQGNRKSAACGVPSVFSWQQRPK